MYRTHVGERQWRTFARTVAPMDADAHPLRTYPLRRSFPLPDLYAVSVDMDDLSGTITGGGKITTIEGPTGAIIGSFGDPDIELAPGVREPILGPIIARIKRTLDKHDFALKAMSDVVSSQAAALKLLEATQDALEMVPRMHMPTPEAVSAIERHEADLSVAECLQAAISAGSLNDTEDSETWFVGTADISGPDAFAREVVALVRRTLLDGMDDIYFRRGEMGVYDMIKHRHPHVRAILLNLVRALRTKPLLAQVQPHLLQTRPRPPLAPAAAVPTVEVKEAAEEAAAAAE